MSHDNSLYNKSSRGINCARIEASEQDRNTGKDSQSSLDERAETNARDFIEDRDEEGSVFEDGDEPKDSQQPHPSLVLQEQLQPTTQAEEAELNYLNYYTK